MLEHADWIRRLARHLVQDGQEAEDVLQETLVIAGRGAPTGVPARAWLAGVVKNVTRSRRRKEVRRHEREGQVARREASVPSALDDAGMLERQRGLLGQVEALPPEQRRAIIARFYDGLPPRKIAAAEGVSVSTINSRIQRGVERLREQLDAEYGDRRTWAAWLVPMVEVGKEASLGGGLLLALGALVLVGGGFAVRALMGSDGGAAELALPDQSLVLADGVPDAGLDAAAGIAGGQADEAAGAERRPVDASSGGVLLTVKRAESGEVVPNADVWVVPVGLFEADTELLFNLEHTMLSVGTRLRTDDQGQVHIPLAPPLAVLASNELEQGVNGVLAGSSDLTVELTGATRLRVRVLDAAGQVLENGVTVGATSRFAQEADSYGNNNDMESRHVSELADGIAYFQNPWLGMTMNGEVPGADNWLKYSIDAVYVDGPGFAEFDSKAISRAPFFPFSPKQQDTERTLVLPPAGSLRIEIRGAGGELAPFDGTARVEFLGKTTFGRNPKQYPVSIVQGVATWPRFVTGSRHFKVRMDLPSQGSQWEFEDDGPSRDGETKVLRCELPDRPSIRARLVDMGGQPLQLDSVSFYYGYPGGEGRVVANAVRASSAADGSVRFELPADKDLAPPYSILARRLSNWKNAEALSVVELTPGDLVAGRDLGTLELSFLDPVELTGHVTNSAGDSLSGVRIGLERPGQWGCGTETDEAGRFEFEVVIQEGTVLEVDSWEQPLLSQQRSINAADCSEPQDFVLLSGASFRASIDMGDLGVPDNTLNLWLRDAETDTFHFIKQVSPGQFESGGIGPGEYKSELRLTGGQVIAGGAGLVIFGTGEFTDPRIDGLRLVDHLRRVDVTWEGLMHERMVPRLRVTSQGSGDAGQFILSSAHRGPFLLPKNLPASAAFTAHERTTIRFDDISAIGDAVHLVFEAPFEVTLVIQGTPSPDHTYHLGGEPASSASGSHISLASDGLASGAVRVKVPAAGPYRLFRSEKHDYSGEGPVVARAAEATGEVVELQQPENGSPAVSIVLVIDSPVRAAERK